MPVIKTLFISSILLFLFSCGNTPQRGEAILDENYQPTPVQGTTASTTTPPPATTEPAQNAQGVWHYTCPNGCEGGAGSATPCGKCGTTLTHNAAYHANTGNTATNVNSNPGNIPTLPQDGSQTFSLGEGSAIEALGTPNVARPVTTPPNKTPEPAQNLKGVWHYTCSDGCAGGAGSAIACASCGKTLVHNQEYHN